MTKQPSSHLGGRPVFIADYRAENSAPKVPKKAFPLGAPEAASNLNRGIRYDFPLAGTTRDGGFSDGYRFQVTFAAGRLERSYELVLAFLQENGYETVPVPATVEELRHFRLPPKLRHQLSLFGENGYVHNPLKILFPVPAGQRGALRLELFNEATPKHLLRFHRRK